MKRKLLSLALALCMIMTLTPVAALADEGDVTETPPSTTEEENTDQTPSAQAENGLPDAVDGVITLTAESYTLLDDITSSIVVPKDATVTLNLNNHTVTNTDSKDTIYVELGGSLTITGNGTVDNTSHQRAAVFNNGTSVLMGGNYTRSQENSTSNTYYNIINHGNMTINNGTSVTQNGNFSSLVENGYYSYYATEQYTTERHIYIENTNQANPKMTIDGGTFSGGINTIKNDDGATLVINDGTFSNVTQAAFLNWNVAEVNGGTFTVASDATAVILNGGGDDTINKGELTITGGTFGTDNATAIAAMDNNAEYLKKENVQITGGTFSSDVSEYVPDGYTATTSNGGYIIDEKTTAGDNDVATVNGQYFTTLSGAIAAAKDGNTVTLLADVGTSQVSVEKALTIDLNNHNITFTGNNGFLVYSGGNLNLTGTGIVQANYCALYMIGAATDDNTTCIAKVGEEVTLKTVGTSGNYVVIVYQKNVNSSTGNASYGVDLTVDGKLEGNAGIFVMGNIKQTSGAIPKITLNETAEVKGESIGIAINGYAAVTVDGATISGSTGIEIRAGELNMSSGTVTGTGSPTTVNPNGSGTTSDGAGIAVAQHTTKLPITVNITGGSVEGYSALYESNPQNNTEDEIEQVDINISGGDFQASTEPAEGETNTPPAIYSASKRLSVSGGSFSTQVDEDYCAEGFEPVTEAVDGKYTVKVEEGNDVVVTSANGASVAYENLAAALTEGIKEGDTITLLADAEYNGQIALPAGVTLDGDGYTLTATGNVADGGFIDVKTDCDNVTIKNLTINTDGNAKHGVQFYCNEGGTLDSVIINGGSYTSVIVNGATDVEIKNCTLNTAGYANVEYAMGSSVTTVPSLKITGSISYNTSKPLVYADKDTIAGVVNNSSATDETSALQVVNTNVTISGMEMVLVDGTLVAQVKPANNGSSSTSGGSSSSSSTTYAVSVDTAKNGTVSVSPKNASKGTTVTITAKPNDGYEVDEVIVTDKNGDTVKVTAKGDDKYTFVMPAGKVDVEVTFVKETVTPSVSFTDVKSGAWYYDAALYAAENGLMSGTGNGAFSPDLTTSRAMIWTILARVDGQNISVTYGNWYDKAQAWAMAAGVSDGTNPDSAITREQLAVMLYGFAKEQGYTTANGVSLSRYVDASDVSAWAVEALEWAVGNGLISSMGNNILAPTGTATRAQVAVILMNFCENIAK